MELKPYKNFSRSKKGKKKLDMEFLKWLILILTTSVQATIAIVAQGVGPLAPFLVSDLGLTKHQVGFTGGAIMVGTAFTAFVSGLLVDHYGEKVVLILGALLTGITAIMASQAQSFIVLILLLFIAGLWVASSTPAGSKAIMQWFPATNLGFALSFRQTGVPIGGAIAALLMPKIATLYDWRMAMIVMGLFPIAGAFACWIFYVDHPSEPKDARSQRPKLKWNQLIRRDILLVCFTALTLISSQYTVITYLILYVQDKLKLSIGYASLSLVFFQLGGSIGRIFWGIVSDRYFNGARKPVITIIGIISSGICLLVQIMNSGYPLYLVWLICWFFGFTLTGWNGLNIAILSKLVGPDYSATAVGFSLTLSQIGVLSIPPLFGLLVDLRGAYELSWGLLALWIGLGILSLQFLKSKNA
jgi:sugar phosphate permease